MNKIKNFIINEEHPVKYIFVISLIIAATIPTPEIDKIPFSWKLIVEILKFQIPIAVLITAICYPIFLLVKKNSK